MPEFRPEDLAQWVSRPWKNGVPEFPITGISHDTRTIKPGNLYVAIRGEQFDGHGFLREAFAKGAAAALVDEHFQWLENPVLRVPDTVKGLWALASGYRKTWTATVIGVTGSVGKTTVKEMVADVVARKGKTHRTAGNYNNHIGLPLTMLGMERNTQFGVFEIGMNHPGEIGALAHLLQPHIATLTDIGSVHREFFQSLEEIAREKAGLIEKLPAFGTAVLDRDSEWFGMMSNHTCASVKSISMEGVADYVGRNLGGGVLEVNGHPYAMPLPGEHVMRNALRAIALGLELGIDPVEIDAGLRQFNPPPMRWEESKVAGITFIDDSYNANPLSMRAVLNAFHGLDGTGRKWAVLGGMRELGETATAEHEALGRFIDELGFDGVVAVGELGRSMVCKNTVKFFQTLEPAGAAEILKENLFPGDKVLLKASRGERLERVLDCFKKL
ncbi:MAG: UDP-N-acetylmuramoyl-tripeptide--D-alanyl-D-alanine ligase [Kiritimatiellales bacterium]|nr:UDP-N-acetylmuramoyl-tripeptide--D-alanyl-D-alanine ligase [Kiritimatiellales bacterium]